MEETRANAVDLLNEAKLCSEPSQKVTLLSQLTELVVRKDKSLTYEFVEQVVVLQIDQAASVRRWLSSFLGEACSQCPLRGVLSLAAAGLRQLVLDGVAGVAKAAVLACTHLLRSTLACAAYSPGDAELSSLLEDVRGMCAAAADSASTARNDSLRVAAVKLRETMVSLFSADASPPLPSGLAEGQPLPRLPSAVVLSVAADEQLKALQDMLRSLHAKQGATQAGPVIIVLLRALSALAVSRPRLLPKALPPLMAMAKEGGYRATGCDEAGPMPGGDVSVGNALRTAMVAVLRSRSDASVPWRDRICEALGAIGACDAAESSMKYIQRQEYKESRAARHRERELRGSGTTGAGVAPDTDGRASKRVRSNVPAAPAAPSLAAGNGVTAAPAAAPPLVPAPAPPPTSMSDLTELLKLLTTILGSGDRSMLDAFLQSVPLAALADLVIANMQHLPPAPPRQLSHAAMVLPSPSVTGTADGRAAQRAQRSPTPPPSSRPPPPPPPASAQPADGAATGRSEPAASSASVPAPPVVGSGFPLPSLSKLSTNVQRHMPRGVAPLPKDAAPVARPPEVGADGRSSGQAAAASMSALSGGVEPLLLNGPGRVTQRDAAVMRLLATDNVARIADMRQVLLSRLVASDPERLSHAMLTHIVDCWRDAGGTADVAARQRGMQLALVWLDVLFVESCAKEALQLAHAMPQGSGSGDHADAATMDWEGTGKSEGAAQKQEQSDCKVLPDPDEVKEEMSDVGVHGVGVTIDDSGSSASVDPMKGSNGGGGRAIMPAAPGESAAALPSEARVALGTDLDGSIFAKILLSLLQHLHDAGFLDAALELLLAAPALPRGTVCSFLKELINEGGDAATSALMAARTVIQGWPALRSTVLDIVLHAAISVSDDTRGKAVRLTVNQLLVNPVARTVAIEFARKALDRLALPSPLHELVDSAAANGGATPASGAAHHTEGSDAPAESDSAGNASAGAAPRAGVSVTAEAPAAAADGGSVDWSQAEASRFCDLYAALCTRSPDLITGLAAALPKASSSAARAAITASACTLARALGPASSLLASLVRQHPCGSEPLVHAMVEAALEGALPSEELVEACRAWGDAGGGIQAKAPLVGMLRKSEVLQLLPELLALPAQQLRILFKKLATRQTVKDVRSGSMMEMPPMFSAGELLVLLHCPPEPAPGSAQVSQKTLMGAVDVALHAPEVFPQQSIAEAISQMEVRSPLPALFMRTVIVAVCGAPKLRPFVADLLSRLISKQIWLDKGQWRGLLMLVENSDKTFFPVMLQLPAPVLHKCMLPTADEQEPHLQWVTAVKLAQFATSKEYLPGLVRQVQATCEDVLRKQTAILQAAADERKAATAATEAAAAAAAAAAEATVAAEASPVKAEQTSVAGEANASAPTAAAVQPEDNFEIDFGDDD